jgi:hypothetical protein
MTYRTDDARTWPELVAERRKAKQEAEAAEKEPTLEEKINLAAERVHQRSGTATSPQRATIIRDPDQGLSRFFELLAEAKKGKP